jgi:hypothetical protein
MGVSAQLGRLGAEPSSRPAPAVLHAVPSPGGETGRTVEPPLRTRFESRLVHDFAGVRVHTGPRAAASARALGAAAYTVGTDIVFGSGRYDPGTQRGDALLAHELVHVAQNLSAAIADPTPARISDRSDRAEHEARELVGALDADRPVGPVRARPQARVQRQELAAVNPEIAALPWAQNVDAFEEANCDIDYRSEGGNLSKWLTLAYADGTILDINVDAIGDSTSSGIELRNALARARVGEGGRVFPAVVNRSTTPRLWEAKRAAIDAMEEFNLAFMMAALPAVLFIITMPLTVGANRPPVVRRAVPRAPRLPTPTRPALDETLQQALRPNTLRHIFGQARHTLDELVRALGSESAVVREAVGGLGRTALPQVGPFEVVVVIAGRNVTVGGAVVNGITRISTMFIRS